MLIRDSILKRLINQAISTEDDNSIGEIRKINNLITIYNLVINRCTYIMDECELRINGRSGTVKTLKTRILANEIALRLIEANRESNIERGLDISEIQIINLKNTIITDKNNVTTIENEIAEFIYWREDARDFCDLYLQKLSTCTQRKIIIGREQIKENCKNLTLNLEKLKVYAGKTTEIDDLIKESEKTLESIHIFLSNGLSGLGSLYKFSYWSDFSELMPFMEFLNRKSEILSPIKSDMSPNIAMTKCSDLERNISSTISKLKLEAERAINRYQYLIEFNDAHGKDNCFFADFNAESKELEGEIDPEELIKIKEKIKADKIKREAETEDDFLARIGTPQDSDHLKPNFLYSLHSSDIRRYQRIKNRLKKAERVQREAKKRQEDQDAIGRLKTEFKKLYGTDRGLPYSKWIEFKEKTKWANNIIKTSSTDEINQHANVLEGKYKILFEKLAIEYDQVKSLHAQLSDKIYKKRYEPFGISREKAARQWYKIYEYGYKINAYIGECHDKMLEEGEGIEHALNRLKERCQKLQKELVETDNLTDKQTKLDRYQCVSLQTLELIGIYALRIIFFPIFIYTYLEEREYKKALAVGKAKSDVQTNDDTQTNIPEINQNKPSEYFPNPLSSAYSIDNQENLKIESNHSSSIQTI